MTSTYVPFFRRFTDEKGRELEETQQLYEWVKARQDTFTETPITIGRRVYEYFEDQPPDIRDQFSFALHDLVTAEPIWELPPCDLSRMSMKEYVEYRNLLHAKQYFFANEERVLQLLHEGLVRLLYGIARELPQTAAPSPFTIPLIYTLPQPRLAIEAPFAVIGDDAYESVGLFSEISRQLYRNIHAASGITDPNSKKPIKYPRDSTLPLNEAVNVYLGDTPLKALLTTPVPLKLTHEERFNHMHIVGGTGAGKTTLLENLILHDLQSEDPPSLVIIDPHGDLIRRLSVHPATSDPTDGIATKSSVAAIGSSKIASGPRWAFECTQLKRPADRQSGALSFCLKSESTILGIIIGTSQERARFRAERTPNCNGLYSAAG